MTRTFKSFGIAQLALASLIAMTAFQVGCEAIRGDDRDDDDNRFTRERGGDSPNSENARTEPRLIVAARAGDLKDVRQLLRKGADVNAFGAGRQTALIAAAQRGRREVVNALLEAGADANLRDAQGKTASEAAAGRGHDRIAETIRKSEVHSTPGPSKPIAVPKPKPDRPRQ